MESTLWAPLTITAWNESTMTLKIDFYSSEECVSGMMSEKQPLGKNNPVPQMELCFCAGRV